MEIKNYHENIEQIHKALWELTQLSQDGCVNKIDWRFDENYDKIFNIPTLNFNNLPDVVSENEFQKLKRPIYYSGNDNIKNYSERFLKGEYKKYTEHKNGTRIGLGYYFTPCQGKAKGYVNKNPNGGILEMKLKTDAKILDYDNFNFLHSEYFPCTPSEYYCGDSKIKPNDNFENQKKAVSLLLYKDRFNTVLAAILGYDGMEIDRRDKIQKFKDKIMHRNTGDYRDELVLCNRAKAVTPCNIFGA
jgi:hypothetical protein